MDNKKNDEHNEIKEFYETTYYKNVGFSIIIPKHLIRLTGKIGIKSGQKILDVACGKGEWLLAAKKMGAKPSGIDLSQKAIVICKLNMPEDNFIAGPAEKLPFPNNYFDIVSCLGALEHFLDPEGALKEMVRVAKNNARFLILVPNRDFLTRRLGFYEGTEQHDIREMVLSLDEWETMFNKCGLQVSEMWRDLHVISWSWISSRGILIMPLRLMQALALAIWPLSWQYQVYMLCTAINKEEINDNFFIKNQEHC
jgi:ubiquinone/menaquinone biosynthesis C-methylase UbiE